MGCESGKVESHEGQGLRIMMVAHLQEERKKKKILHIEEIGSEKKREKELKTSLERLNPVCLNLVLPFTYQLEEPINPCF